MKGDAMNDLQGTKYKGRNVWDKPQSMMILHTEDPTHVSLFIQTSQMCHRQNSRVK